MVPMDLTSAPERMSFQLAPSHIATVELVAKATVPLYRTYEDQIKALREWAKTRARKATGDLGLSELWGGAA